MVYCSARVMKSWHLGSCTPKSIEKGFAYTWLQMTWCILRHSNGTSLLFFILFWKLPTKLKLPLYHFNALSAWNCFSWLIHRIIRKPNLLKPERGMICWIKRTEYPMNPFQVETGSPAFNCIQPKHWHCQKKSSAVVNPCRHHAMSWNRSPVGYGLCSLPLVPHVPHAALRRRCLNTNWNFICRMKITQGLFTGM